MQSRALVITSIAGDAHPVLVDYALQAPRHGTAFIVVGDTKSPAVFSLTGCDFYSIDRQEGLPFELARSLPKRHYARKNLGYLVAIQSGVDVIIETDDDNLPREEFWAERTRSKPARLVDAAGWVNVYRYFSQQNIWPRGFALERLLDPTPECHAPRFLDCPIQQGLADENPDVDAIYRLTAPLPINFENSPAVALGAGSICPFNSQNTTWFREAFPLLYLPSYCSFRMTDIWRSFVAQRICWGLGWPILFHGSTVWQERNAHDLMADFRAELVGYENNLKIMESLVQLEISANPAQIGDSLLSCYEALIRLSLVEKSELSLLQAWLDDLRSISG